MHTPLEIRFSDQNELTEEFGIIVTTVARFETRTCPVYGFRVRRLAEAAAIEIRRNIERAVADTVVVCTVVQIQ